MVKAYGEYLLIHDGLTPEGIAGKLSLDFPERKTTYESLYLWIYTERRDLIPYLVTGHTKRHKRPSAKKSRISKIPNRIDIIERPATVDLRRQAGHGEGDTVVSGQSKACVAVLVERKTRFFMVIRMKDKTATPMHEAVTQSLSGIPCGLRKTLTYDNGLENALHERMNRELGVTSYFCKPYHRWEKGIDRKSQRDMAKIFPQETRLALDSTERNRYRCKQD